MPGCWRIFGLRLGRARGLAVLANLRQVGTEVRDPFGRPSLPHMARMTRLSAPFAARTMLRGSRRSMGRNRRRWQRRVLAMEAQSRLQLAQLGTQRRDFGRQSSDDLIALHASLTVRSLHAGSVRTRKAFSCASFQTSERLQRLFKHQRIHLVAPTLTKTCQTRLIG